MHRISDNSRAWRFQPSRAKGVYGKCSDPRVTRWECPRLVDKFGELDSPPSRPRISHRRHRDNVVVEQILDHHIVSIREFGNPSYHKLNPSLCQIAVDRQHGASHNIKRDARVTAGEPV